MAIDEGSPLAVACSGTRINTDTEAYEWNVSKRLVERYANAKNGKWKVHCFIKEPCMALYKDGQCENKNCFHPHPFGDSERFGGSPFRGVQTEQDDPDPVKQETAKQNTKFCGKLSFGHRTSVCAWGGVAPTTMLARYVPTLDLLAVGNARDPLGSRLRFLLRSALTALFSTADRDSDP